MGWIAVILGGAAAGAVQSISGFGAGMILMMFLSSSLGVVKAPGLSTAICFSLTVLLAIRYRKHADLRRVTALSLPYCAASACAILTVNRINLHALTIAFSLFLIAMSLWNLIPRQQRSVRPGLWSAFVCGAIGGVCSGFFGMGGPLWAIYFISSTESREEYMGNTQICAAVTALFETALRASNDIFTAGMIPLAAIGMLSIHAGKWIGLRYTDRFDQQTLKRLIYIFVCVFGVIKLVMQFL